MSRRQIPLHSVISMALALFCIATIMKPAWAQFETRATTTVSGGFALAVGDFNRDGKLDVAVTGGSSLTILLGNGDGTFKQGASYPGLFYSIAVADFNNDGILDLVVAPYADNVTVFVGNGDGTFQTPKTSPTTDPCGFIAVGDFNGDYKMDLAVVDGQNVSILLGNGDGTFEPPIDNNSFVGPGWLALGDFNNDHFLDVAVVGTFGSDSNLGILLGNGNGTLQSSLTHPLKYAPYSVVAADFSGDGNLDVAIGDLGAGGTTVFLGKGDGSFGPATTYTGGGNLVIADEFSGDGRLDLLTDSGSAAGLAEFLGKGNGTFEAAKTSLSGVGGGLAAAGDFNGDHKLDALLLYSLHGPITTMLNTGVLTFSPSTPLNFPVQLINTASGPRSVKLTNTSTKAVSVSSIQASGDFQQSNNCGGLIAAGANCDIDVVFQPLSLGGHSGLVTIVDGASSKPQVIELSGWATALTLSPAKLNFGDQKAGTTSPPMEVTVTNESRVTITFKEIDIGGTDYKDFIIQAKSCGTTLAPGANCTVGIDFAPTKTGPRTAELVFNVQGGGSPKSVVLTGTGT